MDDSMNAVIYRGNRIISVEQRPVPKIQHPKDIIVKVRYTALCGSDLHVFRGFEECKPGTIMGHEFCGIIVERGSEVKNLNLGASVVSPFTTSCGACFYCLKGLSSRCAEGLVYGTEQLAGAQAQYVRVPLAESTVFEAPDGIPARSLTLMADIFPTGYFAASSAFSIYGSKSNGQPTAVVVGCGPVGLCAILAALEYKPQCLFAVDSVLSRLEFSRKFGARPLYLHSDVDQQIRQATQGRGADIVMELVGLQPALRLGFDLLRPGGVLVSLGVHHQDYPWTLAEAYSKNLFLQMGRCPVRSIFKPSLNMFIAKHTELDFMTDNIMPLTQAGEGYDLFDKRQVQKIIFDAHV